MPDTINKQTLINLLIDSPLREPIKINLIDIVNNTTEPDLPKVFPTIVKELEIFQKATERRMKLADETIAKLGGTSPVSDTVSPVTAPTPPAPAPLTPPPLDLPPLPTPPVVSAPPTPVAPDPTPQPTPATPPLTVPPLDLPPLPTVPSPSPVSEPSAPAPTTDTLPTPQPLGGPATVSPSSDEDALAEIQKELESLKAGVVADAAQTTPPTAPQS